MERHEDREQELGAFLVRELGASEFAVRQELPWWLVFNLRDADGRPLHCLWVRHELLADRDQDPVRHLVENDVIEELRRAGSRPVEFTPWYLR